MNTLNKLAIIQLLFIHTCIFGQTENNKRLENAFLQDQADRKGNVNNPNEGANDINHRKIVLELVEKDSIKTALDYYRAAMIFQHGNTAEDYQKAYEWAKTSVSLNKNFKPANWLIAASWDRYLRATGKPQWYGTQSIVIHGKEYLQSIDETKVTDEDRKQHGTKTVKELLDYYNSLYKLNETSLAAFVKSDQEIATIINSQKTAFLVGTMDELFDKIQYPNDALKNKIEGTVFVEFTVNTDGKVIDAVVLEGLGYGCDEEAIRITTLAQFINGTGTEQFKRWRVPFKISAKQTSK